MSEVRKFRWQPAAVLTVAVWLLTLAGGCASTGDTENLSEKPWNAPKSWEGGLPQSMFEGR